MNDWSPATSVMFMKSVWVPEVRNGDEKNIVLAMSLPEALLVVENVVVFPPSMLKSAEMLPIIESLCAPNTDTFVPINSVQL